MRAIYVRTSTGRQDGEAQLHLCRRAARARGWKRPLQLVDLGESGTRARRPALDELVARARTGEVSEVLVSALDRLGRNAGEVVKLVDALADAGVLVHSLREGDLDPSTAIGRALLQIFAALAELDRGLIVERISGGIERARAQGTRSGKPIGRPPREVDVDHVLELRAAGRSWRSIAMGIKVPSSSVRRAVARHRKDHGAPDRSDAP